MDSKSFNELWDIDNRAAQEVNNLQNQFKLYLYNYEQIVHDIILDISGKNNLQAAEDLFNYLYTIQCQLALIEFKYNISVGEKLYEVIKNFDRLDDEFLREYWFKEFKKGKVWPSSDI